MMTDIQLGPIVLSSARFSALVGLAIFLIAASILGRKNPRVTDWAWNTVFIVVIGARIGFVLENLGAYRNDPLTILYLWQGGFSPIWGITAAVLNTVRLQIGRAAVPLAVTGLLAWGGASMLTSDHSSEMLSLPDITVDTLDGESLLLSDQGGRPLVMNIWEPWCLPCRREMPMLVDAAQNHSELTIAFVSQTSSIQEVHAFLQREGIEGHNMWRSHRSQVGAHFRTMGLPTTLFFDADGILQHRHIGEISRAELELRMASLAD